MTKWRIFSIKPRVDGWLREAFQQATQNENRSERDINPVALRGFGVPRRTG